MRRMLAFAVLTLVPALAPAAGFTFRVPLQIANLDERVKAVKVSCTVALSTGQHRTNTSHRILIDPNTGNPTAAEVLLGVDFPSGYGDPRDALSYKCELIVVTNVDSHPADLGCHAVVHTPGAGDSSFILCDSSTPHRFRIYGNPLSQ